MATNYNLLGTESSIQALSPTLTLPTVNSILQTIPHGVIFDYWLAKADFDAGTAPALLEAVCGGVEHIMTSQPVIAGVGNQRLDSNGLLAQFITFTVAYTPPGGTANAATVDVEVSVNDFGQDTIGGQNFGLNDAIAIIQAAYTKLEALAAG